MSKLYPILLLLASGGCFYAGYTVGTNQAAQTETVSSSEGTTETVIRETQTDAPAEAPTTADIDEATEAMVAEHTHSLRAKQSPITLTDLQGRQLIAEVIEAKPDSLQVRRAVDDSIVTVPVAMLNQEDQAFAAYLAKLPQPADKVITESAPSLSMEDKIWDELFK